MKIHIWDTTVRDDFVSLCNKKKVPINIGLILNGFGAMDVFFLSLIYAVL